MEQSAMESSAAAAARRPPSNLDQLAPALVAAFAELGNVEKNADNPFFQSRYADLGACLDLVKPIYKKHGLAVLQAPGPVTEGPNGQCVTLTSMVVHKSGQHLAFTAQIPLAPQWDKKEQKNKVTPQSVGSAITYLRRYALAALAGIAQVDDDGNSASNDSDDEQPASETPPKKEPVKMPAGSTADQTDALLEKIRQAKEKKDIEILKSIRDQVQALNKKKVTDAYLDARNAIKGIEGDK